MSLAWHKEWKEETAILVFSKVKCQYASKNYNMLYLFSVKNRNLNKAFRRISTWRFKQSHGGTPAYILTKKYSIRSAPHQKYKLKY